MKTLYIWITVLVILGAILSYYLLPSKLQMTVAKVKDQEYKDAQKYLEELYKSGNRSLDMIIPLESLEESLGNIDFAIKILRDYVKTHPQDFDALKKLSDLYQENQESEKYYQSLLELAKVHPDKETLRNLAYWYQDHNQLELWCTIIEKIIRTDDTKQEDYSQLALCFADKKKYKEALLLLRNKRKKFPKDIELSDLFFELWLAEKMDKEDGKKETETLANYVLKKNDIQTAYTALLMMQERFPEFEPYFRDLLKPLISKNLLLETAALEIDFGYPERKEEIYPELVRLYKKGNLNSRLQNLLFSAFLEKREDSLLLELIKTSPAQDFDISNIASLSYDALYQKKSTLAKVMREALGNKYLQKHPSVAVMLALGSLDPDAKEQLEHLLQTHFLSTGELISLMRLSSAAQLDEITLAIGDRIAPYIGVSQSDLVEIAVIYTELKEPKKLLAMLEDAIPKIGEKNVKEALLVLNLSFGKAKEVAHYLLEHKKAKDYLLSGIYTAAEFLHEYPLALYSAKRLLKEHPSLTNEVNYALALVQVGKIKKGIELLNKVYVEHPHDSLIQRAYFDGLIIAAKNEPHFKADLRDFMQKNIKDIFLEDFAYTYLDLLQDYKTAKNLFQILAAKKPPSSDEVQTLVYLWGPKGTPSEEEWLLKRALSSSEKDKDYAEWLKNLAFIGSFDAVIHLFRHRPSYQKEALYAYLDALSYKKERQYPVKCEFQKAVAEAFLVMHSKKDLKKLAVYAEAAETPRTKIKILNRLLLIDIFRNSLCLEKWMIFEQIWRKILRTCGSTWSKNFAPKMPKRAILTNKWDFERCLMEPCNAKVWQDLAKTYFNQGSYTCSRKALRHTFKNDETLYEHGVIMEKRRCYGLSKLDFCKAHLKSNQVYKTKNIYKHPEVINQRALILDKQNIMCRAFLEMQRFYEVTSRDPDSKAAFANLLMDNGCILSTYDLLYTNPYMPLECSFYKRCCREYVH